MKKNILIATTYLNSGGVEVSLVRFLNELSKDKNLSIDLLLLKKHGIYLVDIPQNVNIIEVKYINDLYDFDNRISDFKKFKFLDKLKFLKYRLSLKKNIQEGNWQNYYMKILKYIKPISKQYNLAIDWHGYGHLMSSIVAEKVQANKKVMWIHDEKNDWLNKVNKWLPNFDKLYCVSNSCKNVLIRNYPEIEEKADVFYNLSDFESIRKKSLEDISLKFSKNVLNLITVGRLEWQKGYDIAIETAIILKNKGVNFCWYVIGDGSLKNELLEKIKENHLDNNFKLLGLQKNPFPYIKKSDIYVQTSRHEGYGLSVMEAKILGVICIATDLGCIKEQIDEGINGFLCELTSENFANKIIQINKNKKLMKYVKDNLAKENFDYTKEFKKIYKLMED